MFGAGEMHQIEDYKIGRTSLRNLQSLLRVNVLHLESSVSGGMAGYGVEMSALGVDRDNRLECEKSREPVARAIFPLVQFFSFACSLWGVARPGAILGAEPSHNLPTKVNFDFWKDTLDPLERREEQ